MSVWPRRSVLALALLPACGAEGTTDTSTGSTAGASTDDTPTTATPTSDATTGDTSTGEPSSTSTTSTASTTSEPTTGDDTTSSTGEPPASDAWIERFGAPEDLHPTGLGFGPQGELWVAGDFMGTLDLGGGPLTGAGTGLYLGKFASDGAALHSQALFPGDGEAKLTQVTGLAVDGTGAVVVTGWLEGSYELGGELLTADELDIFVGKWDAAGAPLWGRTFGAVDWQVSEALALASDDSIWIAGATLAPFKVGDIELTGAAETGMFAFRLAPDGAPIAATWWGSAGNQEIRGISACDDDSLAIVGFFDAPLEFGADMVEPAGDKDMFVARIDADAAPLWISAYGGAGTDYATDVACSDRIVFTGVATDAVEIGALELSPAGDADTVLAHLDLEGGLLSATGITGPEDQLPTGVGLLAGGDAVVVLRAAGTTSLGDAEYTAVGASDLLYARYATSGSTPVQTVGLGDAGPQGVGPLATGPDGAVGLTGTISGTVTWPGLRPVSATGPVDLVLVRFTAGD